jgi:hypothetical protein
MASARLLNRDRYRSTPHGHAAKSAAPARQKHEHAYRHITGTHHGFFGAAAFARFV